VYIPGETQEQRRLKRRAIQNGAILIAQIVESYRPELNENLRELFVCLEDSDLLLHFITLINFINSWRVFDNTSPILVQGEPGSQQPEDAEVNVINTYSSPSGKIGARKETLEKL
jgi:hypothetical protein